MKYGILTQTNPEFDIELWSELEDLYKGGFTIARNANRYMPIHIGESGERYSERLRSASYINYLGLLCDNFTSALFSSDVTVTALDDDGADDEEGEPAASPFWSGFARDADLKGNGITKVLRDAFQSAILKGKAIVACDFPVPDEKPINALQEEASGATRGYSFECCIDELIDWEYSEKVEKRVDLGTGAVSFTVGRFEWCILRRILRRRSSPTDARSLRIEEYRVWRMVDGIACWETYRTKPIMDGAPSIQDDVDIPLFAEGRTSFQEIPLIEMSLPPSLWLGNKVGPLNLEHYRRRSALIAAENRSLFAIPVISLGPEIGAMHGAMPSEVQQDPNRAQDPSVAYAKLGFMPIGKDDKAFYLEPAGNSYELVDRQLDKLVDEMARVGQQMSVSISSTSVAVGRSGQSKGEDRKGTEVVLKAYGAVIRDFAERIYTCISQARGEAMVWQAHGMDRFADDDRAELLAEALQAGAMDIQSPTFLRQMRKRLAFALLGDVAPEVKRQIIAEIDANTSDEPAKPPADPTMPVADTNAQEPDPNEADATEQP